MFDAYFWQLQNCRIEPWTPGFITKAVNHWLGGPVEGQVYMCHIFYIETITLAPPFLRNKKLHTAKKALRAGAPMVFVVVV